MVIEKTNFLNEIFLDYQKDKSAAQFVQYNADLFLRAVLLTRIAFDVTNGAF